MKCGTGLIFHHSYTVAPRSCVVNNLSTMTRRKNRFSSLFAGSAKPDSTASTSSPQKLPDHAKRIREAAEAVDEKRVDADLDALFDYISRLSDFIKVRRSLSCVSPLITRLLFWLAWSCSSSPGFLVSSGRIVELVVLLPAFSPRSFRVVS